MARPSKSSTKRRLRKRTSPFIKLGVIGLLGIGGAMALYRGAQAAVVPFRLDNQQEVRIADLRARRSNLASRMADRLRLRNHLRTPEGQEVIARQQGYHQPGEKVYLLRETTSESR